MLHYLSGGSENSPSKYYGKKIKNAAMEDKHFIINFEDNVCIDIYDNGQSCCERRYMHTDDDIKWLIGKTLVGISEKEVKKTTGEYGDPHEIVFLEIMTNDGAVTFSNHNEHNGYYGGFELTIVERQIT